MRQYLWALENPSTLEHLVIIYVFNPSRSFRVLQAVKKPGSGDKAPPPVLVKLAKTLAP